MKTPNNGNRNRHLLNVLIRFKEDDKSPHKIHEINSNG